MTTEKHPHYQHQHETNSDDGDSCTSIQAQHQQHSDEEETQLESLLHHQPPPPLQSRSCTTSLMDILGISSATLAKRLPTGAVLAFQILSPLFTNMGYCRSTNQVITLLLLIFCAFLCFILSFSDSFHDEWGTVRYGFATCKGLWVIGSSVEPRNAEKYRVCFKDFVHGFTSVMVFAAVVLVDNNVVYCFYPEASEYAGRLLSLLPIVFGAFGSFLYFVFPTTRHGFGYPVQCY